MINIHVEGVAYAETLVASEMCQPACPQVQNPKESSSVHTHTLHSFADSVQQTVHDLLRKRFRLILLAFVFASLALPVATKPAAAQTGTVTLNDPLTVTTSMLFDRWSNRLSASGNADQVAALDNFKHSFHDLLKVRVGAAIASTDPNYADNSLLVDSFVLTQEAVLYEALLWASTPSSGATFPAIDAGRIVSMDPVVHKFYVYDAVTNAFVAEAASLAELSNYISTNDALDAADWVDPGTAPLDNVVALVEQGTEVSANLTATAEATVGPEAWARARSQTTFT